MNIIFDQQILENIGVVLFHVNSLIDLKVHLMNLNNMHATEISKVIDVTHGLKEASANLHAIIISNLKFN